MSALDARQASLLTNVIPARTGLLVIDIQRDFCSADGALAALGSDVSPCSAVAGRIAEFLPSVREKLGLVAFFRLIYDLPTMSESQKERLLRNGAPIICSAEGSGADLVVEPDKNDLEFIKHRYSAFTNSSFLEILQQSNISTIAVVGVDTHICVEGTVRHGYDLGYRMLILTDLVATRSSETARHESSIALCDRYFGVALDSSQFLDLLGSR